MYIKTRYSTSVCSHNDLWVSLRPSRVARTFELGKVIALCRMLNISMSFAQWKQTVFSTLLSSKSNRSKYPEPCFYGLDYD